MRPAIRADAVGRRLRDAAAVGTGRRGRLPQQADGLADEVASPRCGCQGHGLTLAREAARAHRYDRRLALIVFDVDDFKAVNDRVGHLTGDAVLAEVAERVRSVVRSADVACRIGGDEFAVILPESSVIDAQQLSARLQETVAARPIIQAGRLDVSAGVAELRQGDDAASLFERADEALYRAKETGKGRVVTAANAN